MSSFSLSTVWRRESTAPGKVMKGLIQVLVLSLTSCMVLVSLGFHVCEMGKEHLFPLSCCGLLSLGLRSLRAEDEWRLAEIRLGKSRQARMLWKTQGQWKHQLVESNLGVTSFRKFYLDSTAWIRPLPPLHPVFPQSPPLPSVVAF